MALVGAVKYLRTRRADALATLPRELHHYLDERIRTSAWYPERDMLELIRATARLVTGPIDQVLEIMGETQRARARRRVRRSAHRLRSTSRAFALWSTQHDTGELRSSFEAPNKLRVELTGFEDTSREFCLILGGYLAGTLAINGITDGSVQKLSCRLWGDSACGWRASWTPLDER